MKIEIITLFRDYFSLSLKQSILGKAADKQLFDIEIIDLRDFATDKHNTVDDTPSGGGGGMVMKVEPIDRCLKSLGYEHRQADKPKDEKQRILLTSAAGLPFKQKRAIEYSLCDRLTIICGHYLGIDERVCELYDLDEISVGDYVLTGGEPAAAIIVDAVVRLIPGALGNFESALGDSYMDEIVGTPCYTRPVEYEGLSIPEELTSGNHALIKKFRRAQAIKKCLVNRPDLLNGEDLSGEELDTIDMKKEK